MSVKQNADNVTWTFDDIALIDCRMPVPYQYSVLRQFDNDPDDDVVDPEHSLNMMVEDTSSDEEEIIDNANQSSTSSKTIGAIDTNPPDANAVILRTLITILTTQQFSQVFISFIFPWFSTIFKTISACNFACQYYGNGWSVNQTPQNWTTTKWFEQFIRRRIGKI